MVLLSIFRSCNRAIRSPSGQDISTNTQYFFYFIFLIIKYIVLSQTDLNLNQFYRVQCSKKDIDDHILSGQFSGH
jgi:hypothetical protein